MQGGNQTPQSPSNVVEGIAHSLFQLIVGMSLLVTILSKWRDHLSCRTCKRALVLYVGQSFFDHMPCLLRGEQKVIIAGYFQGVALDQAWEITSSSRQPVPCLCLDAEEADTRVGLHAVRAPGLKKLICSPDTDVYHIGLQLLWNEHSNFNVFVQISPFASLETRYISLVPCS